MMCHQLRVKPCARKSGFRLRHGRPAGPVSFLSSVLQGLRPSESGPESPVSTATRWKHVSKNLLGNGSPEFVSVIVDMISLVLEVGSARLLNMIPGRSADMFDD